MICSPICINAKVAIKGCNLCPKWGLHNGAIGTVKRIAFKDDNNPNCGDLPEYVKVHFHKLNLPADVQKQCSSKVSENIPYKMISVVIRLTKSLILNRIT